MPMTVDIKTILEEYYQRRAAEEARVNGILKHLVETNPKFKKAREEYSSARTNQVLAKLKGETIDINEAKKRYYRQLKSACKANNITEKDLEIKYACNACKDTGYVGEKEKTFCHCLLNKVTQTTLSNQNLLEDATFDNFDETLFPDDKKIDKQGKTQREHILHVKNRAVKWCQVFPDTKKLQTLFIGATGVGKSFMVNCIAHEIIKRGFSVVNSKASGINEAMLKVINDKDNSLIRFFKSSDLLIIDDLGSEPILRNITIETFYDIIEYRLTNKKHTVIVTNLTLSAIEDRYGYRISSRISSSKNTALMHILGDDLRR